MGDVTGRGGEFNKPMLVLQQRKFNECSFQSYTMANFVLNVFSPHLMFELFDLAHVDVVQLAELLLNERLHLLDLAIELAGQVVQLVLEEHVSRGMETKVLHRNFSLFCSTFLLLFCSSYLRLSLWGACTARAQLQRPCVSFLPLSLPSCTHSTLIGHSLHKFGFLKIFLLFLRAWLDPSTFVSEFYNMKTPMPFIFELDRTETDGGWNFRRTQRKVTRWKVKVKAFP